MTGRFWPNWSRSLEAARNDARQLRASGQERLEAIPDDDYAEQLREVIGELQDATTDLRIERSRTQRYNGYLVPCPASA